VRLDMRLAGMLMLASGRPANISMTLCSYRSLCAWAFGMNHGTTPKTYVACLGTRKPAIACMNVWNICKLLLLTRSFHEVDRRKDYRYSVIRGSRAQRNWSCRPQAGIARTVALIAAEPILRYYDLTYLTFRKSTKCSTYRLWLATTA
jgi:hypothetical protein